MCSKAKNVCQTCLLDLEFGLPVQVRDAALATTQGTKQIPKSAVNREFYFQQIEKAGETGSIASPYDISKYHAFVHHLAQQQKNTSSTPARNKPHVCSFFAKGTCNRGDQCPYRHEISPHTNQTGSITNMRARYFGKGDEVGEKILAALDRPTLAKPQDEEITTLLVSGLEKGIGESEIKKCVDHF